MKYQGSKRLYLKHILPIINSLRKQNQYFIEPFVGGLNVYNHIDHPKMGFDSNKYLVALYNSSIFEYCEITKEEYEFTKKNKELDFVKTAYCGILLSFTGKYFGGLAHDKQNRRNYQLCAYKDYLKTKKILGNDKIINLDYRDIDLFIPENCLIYCDPPYKHSLKYENDFNHEEFYDFCRRMNNLGHTILVSEYQMPDDFIELISYKTKIGFNVGLGKKGKENLEKLYTLL